MADVDEKKMSECRRCYAVLSSYNVKSHNLWHVKIEPELETPTSEFGFWGDKGRWNPNSRDW